ncbi:MAG: site-specific integrase [Deltaproteobacteria bacterium]|nr:site-specific integrase [Deltaproteobacteria bacterium]
MKHSKIIEISSYRKKRDKRREGDRLNDGKKGRVYSRGGKLWVDFYYLGERVREPSGLKDSPSNRQIVRKQLDLVTAEIENGIFEFAERFPHSKKKSYFDKLEGRTVRKDPGDLLFGAYAKRWVEEMKPGMSYSQIRDYTIILRTHHYPYFSKMPFSEICSKVLMKKFIAHLKSKKNRYGQPLSAKRIQNVMIPLRVIVRDAIDEYGWSELTDPFSGLKLPKVRKIRIHPFSFNEWKIVMNHMLLWYRPYFEFTVQTGLRPSEQVALKWGAVDDEYIHIELSRVYNREKADLKTEESRRRIKIRPGMKAWLDNQRELTRHFDGPYVFMNTQGRPIGQDKLREVWARVMKKTGLPYRRMYETRHTFASWALAAGETPEWVARTLGHVDTSMVYRTYGRYIPNLTRQDGSAFERQYQEATNEKRQPK